MRPAVEVSFLDHFKDLEDPRSERNRDTEILPSYSVYCNMWS